MPNRRDALVIVDDPSAPVPAGWRIIHGFDPDQRAWHLEDQRILCRGRVSDDDTASAAILALARGAGLHIDLALTGDARRRFLEDLHRIGGSTVDRLPRETVHLPADQRALLDLLASGLTVTAAAVELHRSRRTVNRMLTDVRERLGVATTAEAVARWNRLRS